MHTPPANYTADHKYLVQTVSDAAGIADPVAFDASYYSYYLLRKGVPAELLPFHAAPIRQWIVRGRTHSPGTAFGARLYTTAGIRFVHVVATVNTLFPGESYSFFIVA